MSSLLNKAWAYVKGLRWIVTLGAILTAVLFALAGARSVSKNNSAKRKEAKIEDLKNSGIEINIKKAVVLTASAAMDKQKAKAAKVKMQERLDKLGESNEDIDTVIDRFNSKRVRKSAK